MLAPHFAAMEPWSRYPFTALALARYLAAIEAGAPRYSLSAGGVLAGALALRLNWLRGPYIQFLGLLPSAQNKGLGAAVLGKIIEDAREAGERNVWVAAAHFNARAVRFYEAHGFVRTALLEGLVQDDMDEVLLRKRL